MTLWILAFEPKCRSAIPSIVSPLCTEYANVSRDVGLALRLGFGALAPGIDPGADDHATTRLLASPSFGPDEDGIGARGSVRGRGAGMRIRWYVGRRVDVGFAFLRNVRCSQATGSSRRET